MKSVKCMNENCKLILPHDNICKLACTLTLNASIDLKTFSVVFQNKMLQTVYVKWTENSKI